MNSVDCAGEERQPEGIRAGVAHCILLPSALKESADIVEERHPEGINAGVAQGVQLLSSVVA